MKLQNSTISRVQLYELAWSEPLNRLAVQFGVSAIQFAEACDALRIPRPAPGYWGKHAVGRAPKRPQLPPAAPGQPAEWKPGSKVPAKRPPKMQRTRIRETSSAGASRVPKTHPLLAGARELFHGSRTAYDSQYLRPTKQLLVDLVVTESGLDKGLSVANRLFSAFEARGYRVSIAKSEDKFHYRPEIDEREVPRKTDRHGRHHLWGPRRITVARVGEMAFGLTIIELAEDVEMRYVGGQYVRETEVTARLAKRPGDWSWTTKKDLPTGRFSVLAYSPYGFAKWSRVWREERDTPLPESGKIVEELENSIPEITRLIEEGKREAEREHQRWRAQMDEWKRKEEAKKRAEALEESTEEMRSIIEDWAKSKQLEAFFKNARAQLSLMPIDEQGALRERLDRAQALIGETDALKTFLQWKTPEEIYPGRGEVASDDGVV
ncbi:FliH/SctL family protein [Dongia rigui]|uniref:Uncharacterized protein n=1 Tax=Dongia rigui TaxID=940149 RepID=A0ABU5E0C3_9PROT|nr:hypothetical protein [Dongia rigui]MDY0872659.1 hypothetical protein [Dongia rigui]